MQPPEKNLKHVLIIDDNQDARDILVAILGDLGVIPVPTAKSPEGVRFALEALKRNRPYNLIIVDIHMPDMNGFEVVQKIREAGYKGGIVAFTAMPTGSGRKESGTVGIDAYFSKTHINRALLETVLEQYAR